MVCATVGDTAMVAAHYARSRSSVMPYGLLMSRQRFGRTNRALDTIFRSADHTR
jgi:hypothetical protein